MGCLIGSCGLQTVWGPMVLLRITWFKLPGVFRQHWKVSKKKMISSGQSITNKRNIVKAEMILQ